MIDILTDETYWLMFCSFVQTLALCYLVLRHP